MVGYLHQRGVRSPELIEHMRIGYAPGGGGLRTWLLQLGYPLSTLRQAGLVTSLGYDAYVHRITFRWKAISMAAVSRLRLPRIVSCPVPKVACMGGRRPGDTRN